MLEIGICGTDREICRFDYGLPPAGEDRLIIGHESLGEVVEVGEGVSRVRKGDLVVTMVRRPCAREDCAACRAGRQDFCYTGGFTERGIIQLGQIQQRLPWASGHKHRAVVLGAGPVGVLGAMALAAASFDTFVYSRSNQPLGPLVESFGASYVAAETHTIQQLAEQLGQVDVIYDATGASRLAFEALTVLGLNAVFIFTGVPGRKGPIEVDTDLLMRDLVLKNQIVYGTVNAGRDAFEAAIRDLGVFQQQWPLAVKSLITGKYPIEQHETLLMGAPPGIKNVIHFM